MNCPSCNQPIDPALVRKAANSIAGSAKRPNATGLVRNPRGRKGRPKELSEQYCNREPDAWKTCERCGGKGTIECWQDGQPGLDYCPNCDGMKQIPLWYVPTKIKLTIEEK